MLKTVGEAKECFCPHFRSSQCKGDLCMAWRWETKSTLEVPLGPFKQEKGDRGYCGLSGESKW